MNDIQQPEPGPPLRASDVERDRVGERLRQHYAVGRLTLPELEERVAVAYGARTREQLDAVLSDLPAEADSPAGTAEVIDSRLLVILLCCAPPAALVYWLVAQRAARRRSVPPRALEDPARRELQAARSLRTRQSSSGESR
jgi:hypothetical protein